MNSRASKKNLVFISYSTQDRAFVDELIDEIEQRFGKESIWIDKFDIEAGDKIRPKIARAVQRSKYFILVISKASMSSKWVNYELDVRLHMELTQDGFVILPVRIEPCEIPEKFSIDLRMRHITDAYADRMKGIAEILNVIAKGMLDEVFEDRGDVLDNLESATHSAKVIYVVGPPGIGKTRLVQKAARDRFERQIIYISIKSFYDTKYLAQKLLSETGRVDFTEDKPDDKLLGEALLPIGKEINSGEAILFLDDAENAIDDDGEFRPFLTYFIDLYVSLNISFPLIVASAQHPSIPVLQLPIYRKIIVEPLPKEFMISCIQKLYLRMKQEKLDKQELEPLVDRLGGYPIAALLAADRLTFESPKSLMNNKWVMSGFAKRAAEYLLTSILPKLDRLHKIILEAISIIEIEIDQNDLLNIQLIRTSYSRSDLEKAVSWLSSRFLIVPRQSGLLSIHPILVDFFADEAQVENRYDDLVSDLALYTKQKVDQIWSDLESARIKPNPNSESILQSSQMLLRYVTSAYSLLVLDDRQNEADQLPVRFQRQVRDLVFTMYERKHAYDKCLSYAEEWLRIEPTDDEIALFKARALKMLNRMSEALDVLDEIERLYPSNRRRAQIQRERGRIAEEQGDLDEAIIHYRSGTKYTNKWGNPSYNLVWADLACALIKRADARGEFDPIRQKDYEDAVRLFNEVKGHIPRFNEKNLPFYVDALAHTGKKLEAVQLLEDAISLTPSDGYLHLKWAELFKSDPSKCAEALDHLKFAIRHKIDRAYLISAEINLTKGEYLVALRNLEDFRPTNPREEIVVKTVRARTLTGLKRFEDVRKLLKPLIDIDNPYINSALIFNELEAAKVELANKNNIEAKIAITNAEDMLNRSLFKFPLHYRFNDLQRVIEEIRQRFII